MEIHMETPSGSRLQGQLHSSACVGRVQSVSQLSLQHSPCSQFRPDIHKFQEIPNFLSTPSTS